MALKIGTIGYAHLFPELPPSARFRRYAKLFDSVELPQTYNRIPDKELVRRWVLRAPPGFVYSFRGPKHLHYRPSADERRTLRKFLRRYRLLGERRGGVRFTLPQDADPKAFSEWLAMLAELGLPGDYAFEGPPDLVELAQQTGYAAVGHEGGKFLYLIDPPAIPPKATGYAYFHHLEDALRYSTLAQGGTNKNQTR